METIQFWANMAAIVGFPIAIVSLIIGFRSLRARIKNCERQMATFNEIINLQNQYYSKGAQYHGCTFNCYDKEISLGQIRERFAQGTSKESENE